MFNFLKMLNPKEWNKKEQIIRHLETKINKLYFEYLDCEKEKIEQSRRVQECKKEIANLTSFITNNRTINPGFKIDYKKEFFNATIDISPLKTRIAISEDILYILKDTEYSKKNFLDEIAKYWYFIIREEMEKVFPGGKCE